MNNDFTNTYRVKFFKCQGYPDEFFEKDVNDFLNTVGAFQLFTNTVNEMFIITIVY